MEPQVIEMLSQYKGLIDFTDQTQKGNFKWVEQYVRKQSKQGDPDEAVWFLGEAIDLQHRYLRNQRIPTGA